MTNEYYPFQSSDDERQRLIAQGELVAPLTRRLFGNAGIRSGMRVLDIGSGSGDVTFLAAQLVGPEGNVVGVDRDPAGVAFAGERAKAAGLTNVRFMTADFREIVLASAVDAIVGRLVLMYTADPLDALRRALRNLRSGGVIALEESIIEYDGPVFMSHSIAWRPRLLDGSERDSSIPVFIHEWECDYWPNASGRFGSHDRNRHAGTNPAGSGGALFSLLTSVVRSQISAIVASGAATEAEIDIETLEERLIDDAPPNGVVGYFNSGHIGIWAAKP